MIKKEKGITLVTLIITIVVMLIITSTTISLSLDRFEINDVRRMINDLELLSDKVSNYYSKYERLPILRDNNNQGILYTYTSLNFEKNAGDNSNYYILDLTLMTDIALNYGREFLEKQGSTDDVYIINEASHTIYYVKGIKKGDKIYHFINAKTISVADNVPPTNPEIKVISGVEEVDGFYVTDVEIDILAGKDNWSGIKYTEYTLDNWNTRGSFEGTNKVIELPSQGIYNIKARSYDNNNLVSEEASLNIEVHKEHVWDSGVETTKVTCSVDGITTYTCTNTKCGEKTIKKIASTGRHSFGEEIIVTAGTCVKGAEIIKICDNCDEIQEVQGPKDSTNHTSTSPEYVNEGFEHKHLIQRRCNACNAVVEVIGYEWHNPWNDYGFSEIEKTAKFTCLCGEYIEMDEIDRSAWYSMIGNPNGAYFYYWKRQGYTDDDL